MEHFSIVLVMARGLEVSSKLPNYTKKKFFRPSQIEVSLNARGKSEDTRYQLRISNLHRSDFQEERNRLKWITVRINQLWKLKYAVAISGSSLVSEGEIVALLVSQDGRKLPLRSDDFNGKDIDYFAQIYKGIFSKKNYSTKDLVRFCKVMHKPHYCMPDTHRAKKGGKKGKKRGMGVRGSRLKKGPSTV